MTRDEHRRRLVAYLDELYDTLLRLEKRIGPDTTYRERWETEAEIEVEMESIARYEAKLAMYSNH